MTFGVLFSNVVTFPQMEMWRGINEYAAQRDIHLLGYIGCYQSSNDDFTSHLNTCFDSIYNSKKLDGVILFSGYIPHHIGGNDVYDAYIRKIPRHIACVSLSYVAQGIPSIVADNENGIYSSVDHLIKVHNKKKIVFIRGPVGNSEAEDRLKGYKKALAENGLPFVADYVLPGDFSNDSAQKAVRELLDVRKLPFDAVVASNDIMAITVLTEFKARGIQVPNEISVTGFDDDREAATFIPSVSTAGQDFFAMGYASAETLFAKINGQEVDAVRYVPSVFIPRQSCGCFRREFINMENHQQGNAYAFTQFVLDKLVPLFHDEIPPTLAHRWVTMLADQVTTPSFQSEVFLSLFEEIILNYSHLATDYFIWQEVINVFMVSLQRFAHEVGNIHAALEALLHASTVVHDISSNQDKIRENRQSDLRMALRRVTSTLVPTFDVNTLADELCRLLPEVRINMAIVGLYHSPVKSNDSSARRDVEILLGFDGKSRFYTKKESGKFNYTDVSSIVEFDFNRERRTLFYFPLFFKDEESGVIILPYDPSITQEVDIYEALRVNISTAIKGAELITKIQSLSITDELTGLYNRRGFFQFVSARMDVVRRNGDMYPVVLFLDMDGLKDINDTLGHKEGDRAIQIFAKILRSTLRKEDIIGRVGGDEFIVFSTVKEKYMADSLVARLRAGIDDYNTRTRLPYRVECSIGHVALEETTRECFEAAIQSADAALYEEKMKKKGRRRSTPGIFKGGTE
ncbi:MAG: GGDEF domain-containing protein [Defluviitaleaceae bacterium]|nr:GGDEF domain-containing protein [Defluviitaleaceae bacterium]MCL2274703.1 GGDEF domain-containing protein [Defluviitaleaceae bacterium]